MTANAKSITSDNRRPIRWWHITTLVVALLLGLTVLAGASMAASPSDAPGKGASAAPAAGQEQPDICPGGFNYQVVTATAALIPGKTP